MLMRQIMYASSMAAEESNAAAVPAVVQMSHASGHTQQCPASQDSVIALAMIQLCAHTMQRHHDNQQQAGS